MPKLAELLVFVTTIRLGIAQRGFYILLDDRIKLICGPNYATDTADRDTLRHFAATHGWFVEVEAAAVTFWPTMRG